MLCVQVYNKNNSLFTKQYFVLKKKNEVFLQNNDFYK